MTMGANLNSTGSYVSLHDGLVQNVFYVQSEALQAWQVKELYDYESANRNINEERLTMAYDEETDSWAKWDTAFDTLDRAEHSNNRTEILGTRNGFVHRLFDGATDGSRVVTGGNIPLSGTLTSVNSATITDSNAVFPTDDDGLAGVRVLSTNTATTGRQWRTIIGNTETNLYLDRPLSPSVTGTYYVAPIEWHWESPWMDFGDPAVQKRLHSIFVWQREKTDGNSITLKYKTNRNETYSSTAFTTTDEFVRRMTHSAAQGRRVKVRFENVAANEDVELEAFQFIFSPMGTEVS